MKTFVLCGGHGTRLGELTQTTPKPMVSIAGRPLLEYVLRNLVRHGFDDALINLHAHPEAIPAYFGDGAAVKAKITYVPEQRLYGTAGSVWNAREYFAQQELFLVHYGDILTTQDLTAMTRFHRQSQAAATMVVHRRPGSNSMAELAEDGRVLRFLERPSQEQRDTIADSWVFSGILVCSPSIFVHCAQSEVMDFPRHVFPELIRRRLLYATPLSGVRCAIDTPERLATAERLVAEGYWDA